MPQRRIRNTGPGLEAAQLHTWLSAVVVYVRLRSHELWVEIYRVIAELGFGDRLQALTSLRQVRISLHPSGMISSHSVRSRGLSADLKQSMCMVCLDLYSSSLSGLNPISSYILIPWILARISTNGKSKLSPLYVAMTVGLHSRICSNQRRIRAG